MNVKKNKVIIIAHRGASKIAPENTLKAFQKAIELEVDYIEFDIHHTLDKEIVINHDTDTLRTTGVLKKIKDTRLEELRILDAGEGEKIPTLRELINIAKGQVILQPEIKVPGLTHDLVSILREYNLIENSIVSCFEIEELLEIKETDPKLKLGYLIPKVLTRFRVIKHYIQRAIENEFYAIHPFYQAVNRELIDFCHRNNLKVNVWTVNEEDIMMDLIELEVDGIFTDDVMLLRSLLRKSN